MQSTVAIIAAIAMAAVIAPAAAQDGAVMVSSHSMGNTAIITLSNSGSAPVATVDMWLAEGNSFESFKTGSGWTGLRQAEALLTFSASTPLGAGASAQFGVETSAESDGINWRALDAAGNVIAQDKTVPGEAPPPPPPPVDGEDGSTEGPAGEPSSEPAGIIDGTSQLRVIPGGPHQGATVRVVGEGFGANSALSLSLASSDLGSISTGEHGRFVHTASIPADAPVTRVDLVLSDESGNTLQKAVRIGEPRERSSAARPAPADEAQRPLAAGDVPATISGGETVRISGTAHPGADLLITLKNPLDDQISIHSLTVGSEGTWERNVNTQSSWTQGRYTVIAYDGSMEISRSWDLESGQPISIQSRKPMYNPGETIAFSGTAQPGLDLEVSLENPQGTSVYEDIIAVGESGRVSFEVATDTPYIKGTYVMFLSQGLEESISVVGLGARPEVPFVVDMDRLNYDLGDTATISIIGRSESSATLVVVHPATHKEKARIPITLDIEGNYEHTLELSDFTRGIYSATVYFGNNSSNREFTVGLQHNAGTMTLSTTKDLYTPGELVTVLGVSERAQALIDVEMLSPSGDVVRRAETFTTATARFTASFFVSSNPEPGTWTLVARSGTQTTTASFDVASETTTGITMHLTESSSTQGTTVTITGEGAVNGQDVSLSVTHSNGETVFEQRTRSTAGGAFSADWVISRDAYPGIYTIRASDAESDAEMTYEVR